MQTRHYLFVVVAMVLLYALYLGTPWHWWFCDDTVLMARARDVAHPFVYFFDREAHKLAVTGNELAPMLMASFAVDQLVSPKSPTFAYWHSIALLVVVAIGLFFLAAKTFGKKGLALAFVAAWLLLPSTIAAHGFLSARHYVFGLGFAVLAILLTVEGLKRPLPGRGAWIIGSVVAAFGACVSKEYFPTALPVALVLLYGRARCWGGVAATFVMAAGYAVYRLWMVNAGTSLEYGMPHVPLAQFVEVVARLPYMLAGGWGGYAIVGGLAALLALAWRRGIGLGFPMLFGGAVLLVSVATIYPVGVPLLAAWKTHGTWVRTPFLINTLVLAGLFYLVAKLDRTWLTRVAVAATLVVVAAGAGRTRREWNALKLANEVEGKAILEQTAAAVYVDNPAWWFMIGVGRLYKDQEVAPYIQAHRAMDDDQKIAREAKVLLRYSGGKMVSDPALKEQIASGAKRL